MKGKGKGKAQDDSRKRSLDAEEGEGDVVFEMWKVSPVVERPPARFGADRKGD